MSENLEDDEILIEEDLDNDALANIAQRTWKIAIVDDDEDVHRATEFSLLDVKILNRRLEFIHTYSKAETHQRFAVESDIAVVLLDVVMETRSMLVTFPWVPQGWHTWSSWTVEQIAMASAEGVAMESRLIQQSSLSLMALAWLVSPMRPMTLFWAREHVPPRFVGL